MTNDSDKQNDAPAKADPPGPADHNREGGMATRENAAELTEPDREE